MTKIALFLLVVSTIGWAQSNSSDEQYPITVHVSSSQWMVVPTGLGPQGVQKLTVTINGKKYELEAEARGRIALLALGDYNAKLIEDVHKHTYESSQTYEFHFSDNTTRKFFVIGQSE